MRLVVLAHDKFDPKNAKTAHAVVKYAREGWSGDEVVAVVDRAKAGRDASEFVGPVGKGVPIVASVRETLPLKPDALVVGIAPVGGALPQDWTADIEAALTSGVRVVSGLHTSVAKDPRFHKWAHLVQDVRHQHPPQRIATGEGLGVEALVVTAVGTDCSSGKMTAAIELTKEARRRGVKAAFVATGQTGIMVGCDAGAPLDALVSDFVAGAMEECVLEAYEKAQPDIIFVEGQGSITHPAYAGVTAGLLHGSFPDVLLMCDEPRREFMTMPGPLQFVKPSPARERLINEAHVAQTTQARVGAAALMTRGLAEEAYLAERDTAEKELGVPAGDVFRGDAGRILDGILAEATRRGLWSGKGFVRGVKSARVAKGVV